MPVVPTASVEGRLARYNTGQGQQTSSMETLGPNVPGEGWFTVLVEDAARLIGYSDKHRPAKAILVRPHLHD